MSETTFTATLPAADPIDIAPEHKAPPLNDSSRNLFRVLAAVSFCHMLNDMVQSLLPSIYPILKSSFHLNFTHLGFLTLTYQVVASLLQPLIGRFTDGRPVAYSLPIGMTFTLAGLILLAFAPTFGWLLFAASLVGVGSAIFHPESSRIARMASGGKHGFAQSFFQVGGNAGSAIGPLLAAFIVLPQGQKGMAWFAIPAIIGIAVLLRVGRWYKARQSQTHTSANTAVMHHSLSKLQVTGAIAVLLALVFSKYFYLASLSSYYTFYLINRFQVSVRTSQILLFLFLGAVAAGTLIGGSVGDRYGRKLVIWISILGVLPFTLVLPFANLFWTGVLSVIIGFVISSAFSAILVYAQDLLPGRVGTVSGLFFGFAFGMGGIGAAVLGKLADATSIAFVYHVCSYLPAIGLLTGFLPNLDPPREP
ncbi:FSR family fosmidomycin resistance protein-like MFS transporter [Edaphobacter aggregans]|uniref:FSR family fosmidomycin resistance protein-like MFS transporter n=1 Tax=Edaphobacter aggregans TaxID=570835 RepID=A0A3R9WH72_9BACT|nr:MFS transporter [Edaphobacter aggregans]RSL17138.1 FSR family fosmidomycin resistance protein-like MFS transporter [Edaphobacter aggregans]